MNEQSRFPMIINWFKCHKLGKISDILTEIEES